MEVCCLCAMCCTIMYILEPGLLLMNCTFSSNASCLNNEFYPKNEQPSQQLSVNFCMFSAKTLWGISLLNSPAIKSVFSCQKGQRTQRTACVFGEILLHCNKPRSPLQPESKWCSADVSAKPLSSVLWSFQGMPVPAMLLPHELGWPFVGHRVHWGCPHWPNLGGMVVLFQSSMCARQSFREKIFGCKRTGKTCPQVCFQLLVIE